MANIMSFSEITKGDVKLVGYKGINIAALRPHFKIPAGFVITTDAYEEVLSTGVGKKIEHHLDKLTDEELEEFYNNQRAESLKKELFVKINSLTFITEEDAILAHKDLVAGTKYQDVKVKYSEGLVEDNRMIGDMTIDNIKQKFGNEFGESILARKKGDICEVFKSDEGYVVAYIDDKIGDYILPLDNIKDDLRAALERDKSKVEFEKFFNELKKNKKQNINEALFKRMNTQN